MFNGYRRRRAERLAKQAEENRKINERWIVKVELDNGCGVRYEVTGSGSADSMFYIYGESQARLTAERLAKDGVWLNGTLHPPHHIQHISVNRMYDGKEAR